MMGEQAIYYLWLMMKSWQPNPRMGELISTLGGIENVYKASEREYFDTGLVKKSELAPLMDKSLDAVKKQLRVCRDSGIDIVCLSDALYPELLSKIYNPPLLLFVRGDISALNTSIVLSMVGTRHCSQYGSQVAEMLARGLAAAGAIIVSGMALGVDSYVHKGAIAADGKTVAVLGSGLDVIYPSENALLYKRIAETGAVISEYPLGTHALKENFPIRNRIIAGLAVGTIVVEAPEKSGALITARIALDEGRDLFAVPGSVFYARGSNALLKECAKLVTDPVDVLEEYADNFYDRLEHSILTKRSGKSVRKQPEYAPVGQPFDLSDNYKEPTKEDQENLARETQLTDVEKTVKAVLTREPKHADEIIRASGLPASQVCAALAMLELKKHIFSLPGGRFYKE